jgi:hypothetical protein
MSRFIELFWCNKSCTTCWALFFITSGLALMFVVVLGIAIAGRLS